MTTNNLINRDALLGKTARRYDIVTLPGGDCVRIQSLTELEKSEYENSVISARGRAMRSKMLIACRQLVVLCVVDGEGNRMLSSDDISAMSGLDGAVTAAIFTAARTHCGFEEGDIEGLVKNSESVRVEDSPTSSPASKDG